MDDDMIEIKRLFFTILSDARPAKQEEAAETLHAYSDERVDKLVAAGRTVRQVVGGKAGPDALKDVITAFTELPETDYWHGFMETSGQAVLQKGLRMSDDKAMKKDKLGMVSQGFAMLRLALGPGFPLSEETMGLVKTLRKSDGRFARDADEIIGRNQRLTSENADKGRQFRRGPPRKSDTGRTQLI
ncbi:MAG: hypothetical protein PHF60_05595 [Candidatus ainarchaeum sp.]|nr:hypothetical protein [Candidatus ainarchaeum sp.]